VEFERDTIRRSAGCCRSRGELLRKAREGGDGYYYLPAGEWPAATERILLQKRWAVTPSAVRAHSAG